MRVVEVNGRFLTQATTGVQRYAVQMVQAIDRQLASDQALRRRYTFRLVTPRRGVCTALPLEHIQTYPVGRFRGHLWEQLELPRHVGDRLVLNLCNTAPLAARSLVTIHDASVFVYPETYSLRFRVWYRALIPTLGKRSVRILTVSDFSRGELSQRAGIPAGKIDVIHLGGEHILRAPADLGVFARVPVKPGSYILAVGSRSPHKNMAAVVAAVSRLGSARPPLVTAGAVNPRVFNVPGDSTSAGLHSAGYVTDAELRALYQNAICLVYPSLYEGFGLPPLEAMTCGCPAVVANVASLPEVCGDAVLYCNPRDPDDIARGIGLMQEPGRREQLRGRGLERARRFTWQRASETLLGVIDRLQAA